MRRYLGTLCHGPYRYQQRVWCLDMSLMRTIKVTSVTNATAEHYAASSAVFLLEASRVRAESH